MVLWIFLILILMSAYSGQIHAALMMKTPQDPIDSFEDILESKAIPLVDTGSIVDNVIQRSSLKIHLALKKRLVRVKSEANGRAYWQMIWEKLQSSRYVAITDEITVLRWVAYVVGSTKMPCEIYQGKEKYEGFYVGMFMSRRMDERAKELFTWRVMTAFDTGMTKRRIIEAGGEVNGCIFKTLQPDYSLTPLHLGEVKGIFLCLFIGLTIAILSLCIEMILKRHQ